jgi:hypothetical protein
MSDKDVFKILLTDADVEDGETYRHLLPNILTLIEIMGIQWVETATCERGFSLRTIIKTCQRYSMGDSLLACLMLLASEGPDLGDKKAVEELLLAAIARFNDHKRRFPSKSHGGPRSNGSAPQRSVLAELAGLNEVLYNDFIQDRPAVDEEGELPDPQPLVQEETAEERAAREEREREAFSAVGDYKPDAGVTVADMPLQGKATIKELKHKSIAHRFDIGWSVGVVKTYSAKGPYAGKFDVKYKDDRNLYTHELLLERYGVDKDWVLLNLRPKNVSFAYEFIAFCVCV